VSERRDPSASSAANDGGPGLVPALGAIGTGVPTPGGGTNLAPGGVGGTGALIAPGGGQTMRSPSTDGGIGPTPTGEAFDPPPALVPDFENPFGDPPGFNPPHFGEEPGPGGDPENPGPDFPPIGPETPTIDLETPPVVVPVPEPGTFVLLGSGLALAAWKARQKNRRNPPT
jgi:hypothetical protein